MESKFNGITVFSASKQLNTEISTLVKDLIYAISQLSSNGLIESIESIFNETLEINDKILSNSNTKLNLCHLFGLMYVYQCTIKLTHISKLNEIHNDDDRKSNNLNQYDVDLNILELFESNNRGNKFKISYKTLSKIQSFANKECILLYYGQLSKIENLTANNENNDHLMNTNKKYCNKFQFKRNVIKTKAKTNKSRIDTICFNIHTMNHKIWKECKILQNEGIANLNMPGMSTSKTKSVSILSQRKKCNATLKPTSSQRSITKTKPKSCKKDDKSNKSKGVNYLKMSTKELGPYHDKNYHSFGRRHNLPKYTMEEVSKHNTKESCWIIVDNLVLDVTPFLPYHPASQRCIINNGGKNCDGHFKFHSKTAQQLFWKFVIGRLDSDGVDCIIQ